MADDVECLLVHLFAIRLSSLVKSVFTSLVHLVIMLDVSLLLSFERFFLKKKTAFWIEIFSWTCSTGFEGYSMEKVTVSFPGEHDMAYIDFCRKATFAKNYFFNCDKIYIT